MRDAICHPWIYLKSDIERTLPEIHGRSRHEITLYTSRFDRAGTHPGLSHAGVVELRPRVSVRRSYLPVPGAALRIAATRIDPARHDVLVISCDGLGDLLTLRNRSRPLMALVFTPLRAVFHEVYRDRLLGRLGPARPFGLTLEAGFKALHRLCWRHYDWVVAISDTVRQGIVRGRLCPSERVEVLQPGIAAARIAPGRTPGPYLLIAGRIVWTNNLRLGLEAFALVRARLAGWRLVIAGMVDEKSRG